VCVCVCVCVCVRRCFRVDLVQCIIISTLHISTRRMEYMRSGDSLSGTSTGASGGGGGGGGGVSLAASTASAHSYSGSGSGSGSLSGAAMQRRLERQQREQLDSLHKLLEDRELRLVESNKLVNKLTQEFESASRVGKQYEKKCAELSKENQKLKLQLESSIRVNNPNSNTSTLAQSLSARNGIALADELQKTKASLERTTRELERVKANESDLMVRSKILSDALEFRMEEIGLSGHADLLAKVAALRGEVTALRSELGNKRDELQTIETEKQDWSSKQESLQRQVSLMQLRLTQSQEELKKLSLGDLPAQLKSAQQERDVLLEFVEGINDRSFEIRLQDFTTVYFVRRYEKKFCLGQGA
jgi:chromosome segregation ATPase